MEKGKEEGWNQVKRTKTAHKSPRCRTSNGKGPQTAPVLQTPSSKDQENKFGHLSSAVEDTQEVEKQKEDSPHKETPLGSKQGEINADRSKEKYIEGIEEVQGSEDLEEEGEIGDSQTLARRSTRGRMSAHEKREQETYKEKLQGSQPTLEKLLEKTPKMTRN